MIDVNPFTEAVRRIILLDTEVLYSVSVSLLTSLSALCIASLFSVPLSLYLGLKQRLSLLHVFIRYILDALLAIPTVLLGLLGYILFSQQGIFSYFSLLYTTAGMSIILSILAFPLLTSLLLSSIEGNEEYTMMTALTLGASKIQALQTLLWEKRRYIIMAFIATFTRLISEIGIAMMVGGNIKNHTRTITTAIALETGKGNFSLGLALGILLLLLSTTLTVSIRILQRQK